VFLRVHACSLLPIPKELLMDDRLSLTTRSRGTDTSPYPNDALQETTPDATPDM
jgi:hypothetical protein